MSPTLTLYDGGTRPILRPLTSPPLPGMDALRWHDVDYEHWAFLLPGEREAYLDRTNPEMRKGRNEALDLQPWPEKVPYHMPVDRTTRYEADDGGLKVDLLHEDRALRTQALALADGDESELAMPAIAGTGDEGMGSGYLHATIPARVDGSGPRRDTRFVRKLSWREAQTRHAATGETVLRRDFENEVGATELVESCVVAAGQLHAPLTRLRVPDNPLFCPFDLSHPERYYLRSASGEDLTEHALDLNEEAVYNVYLRPRQWRILATLLAHYLYISWFEQVPNDEWFLFLSFDRPPTFPLRHDLLHTRLVTDMPDYFGILHSWDPAINWQWQASRAAAELARQLFEQQYYSLCLIYVFLSNEAPVLLVEQEPPTENEVVAMIGRYDVASREESLVQVHARGDHSEWYPRAVLGTYLVPWSAPVAHLF